MNDNIKKVIIKVLGIISIIVVVIFAFFSVVYTLGYISVNTKYIEYTMNGTVTDVYEYYYTHGTEYSYTSDLLRDIQIMLDSGEKITIKQKNVKSDIHNNDYVKIKYIEKYISGKYISSEFIIIE